jgi:hypothetical protein
MSSRSVAKKNFSTCFTGKAGAPSSVWVVSCRGQNSMRSQKGSHRIVVKDVEYRWRATGNDGYILIGIWPSNNIGPFICGNLKYHETWINNGDGSQSSAKDPIVITSRIIERIIEYAIGMHGYNPDTKGKEANLGCLDDKIRWDDAIRAS